MENAFKLYVVGWDTPNPEVWKNNIAFSLVIATSPAEARNLAGAADHEPIAEIPIDRPMHLLTNFGVDD